jgi:hypothetical protein
MAMLRGGLECERWVLLVTDGLVIEYAPEVYRDEHVAERESERWARILSQGIESKIERPFEGRWEIGDHWVRLVPSQLFEDETSETWVGTYWTRDGYPEPEAALFTSRQSARDWVVTPAAGRLSSGLLETPWYFAATYKIRGEEEYAVAHLAKVVS